MSNEYAALVAKVTAFTQAALERTRRDMACARGCDQCCFAWLTLDQVEAAELRRAIAALPASERARIAERGRRELQREQSNSDLTPRCALLEDDGSCAAYEARPLVCRTQGFALRYPTGFVPVASVRMRMPNGDVTHCPLNFTIRGPAPGDVLDAERVDQLLALVNQRFCDEQGIDVAERHAISALAAQADE
jgi:Fe-S-cluster containining protein